MKTFARLAVSLLMIFALLLTAVMPCGPGYISPLFDTRLAPEDPFTDFAAGRLGIVKPTYRRSVLFAAYRWIAGSGLNAAEQSAAIEVWNADLKNKSFTDEGIDEAVKAWVERRKEAVGNEETTPAIYVERSYGGYDFFPNCTRNAFETASETLSDRMTAYGRDNPHVLDWIAAQDKVFENCSSGKRNPEDVAPGSPVWLEKDRAYQKGAAAFYALDYEDAKKRFAEIAQDTESPWQETADYLVARTLIRQASLTKSKDRAAELYEQAERRLERFVSRSGKFSPSSERMMGLIAYRVHPKERVGQLARKLAFQGGNDNFRQDLIDYTWLLDKFETDVLRAEEERKQAEAARKNGTAANTTATNSNTAAANDDGHLELNFYAGDKYLTFKVRVEATDDEAIAAAEKTLGEMLTDQQKEQVRYARQSAYAARFNDGRESDYQGGYWGDEKMSPSLLPAFLKQDELTDWLFVYQMTGPESYLYARDRFIATGSELWLMTAIAKADKSSAGLPRIIDAATNANRSSTAYTTIAYHLARVLLEQGKQAEARRLIDEMLNAGDQIPISSRNSFLSLRVKLAETMDEWLAYSLRKPFAFDFDGDTGTIEEFIAEQKSWYDPQNSDGQTREQHDAEVEARFTQQKLWQERQMFDADIIEVFNKHFPTSMLIEAVRSPAMPDHMKERFAVAIWMRAFMLDDMATMLNVTPELVKYHPEFAAELQKVTAATTQPARDRAALYFVLKNPLLSPYIEDGMGKTDNEQEQWSANDWWCAPYDTTWDDAANQEVAAPLPPKPRFLTPAQSKLAQTERSRLRDAGDAPKYLAAKVLAWAKAAPADRRVPEALYIVIEANGWTKYGCGNNEELRSELSKILKTRYPSSEFVRKLESEEQ
jgi:hypothetical protein